MDNKKPNLYWPIYQNLENELLNITNYIKFEDKQLTVYSDMLLNLLFRISIEIESISKDLYLSNGGKNFEKENEMFFDTTCLDFLENKWELSKKVVRIVNSNMLFSEKFSKLTPLKKANKRGSSGSKWKKAYQAIKHNRAKNYELGNLENCINALAALFILNIYYKDNEYYMNNSELNKFDTSQGSKIFAIDISIGKNFDGNLKKDSASTYFINYSDDFIKNFKESHIKTNLALVELLLKEKAIKENIESGKITLSDLVKPEKAIELVGIDKFKKYYSKAKSKSDFNVILSNEKFHAYLNKEVIAD